MELEKIIRWFENQFYPFFLEFSIKVFHLLNIVLDYLPYALGLLSLYLLIKKNYSITLIIKKMAEELINAKLDELNSLPGEENGKPYIPVRNAVEEASTLYSTCMKDKEELIKAKLDWTLVDDLETRTGALQRSQSQWLSMYRKYEQCQEEWKIAVPLAYKFRDQLIHDFRHALHNSPTEYAKVKRIDEGSSNADMIQDLSDLAELGKNHIPELEAIGFDLSKLDEAREKALSLTKLQGEVNTAYRETSPLIELRNKAYMHLKEAVDEIRRVGTYIFWKDKKKVTDYSSAYLRKRHKSYSKKVIKPQSETKE